MRTVWMQHPSLPGQEINVPESAAPVHAHSGWVLMDAPPERLAELPDNSPDTESAPGNDRSGSQTDEAPEPTGAKRTRRTPKEDDH